MTAPAQPTLPEKLTPGLPVTMYRMETGLEHFEVHVTDRGEKGDADVSRPVGGLVVPCKVFSRDREFARDLAAEIAKRYNAHAELLAFVEKCERAGAMASRGVDAIDLMRLIEMDAQKLLAAVRGRP